MSHHHYFSTILIVQIDRSQSDINCEKIERKKSDQKCTTQ